jgi:quercetin dioxygenase-like cupin family protein
MSSLNRPLTGAMLQFTLDEHLNELRGDDGYQRSGRSGRTLAKSGPLRVTLVALRAGCDVGTHQAESPMTLQVLRGHIRFRANDQEHELREGQLLFFGPGDANDIRAVADTALLLTLAAQGDDYKSGG